MYVGIDYHKRYAVATSMDDKGQVVETVRLKNEPGDLIGFVDRLPADSKIAIEATGNWYYLTNYWKAKARRSTWPIRSRPGRSQKRESRPTRSTRKFSLICSEPTSCLNRTSRRERYGIFGRYSGTGHRWYRFGRRLRTGSTRSCPRMASLSNTPTFSAKKPRHSSKHWKSGLLPAGDRWLYQTDRDVAAAHRRSDQDH